MTHPHPVPMSCSHMTQNPITSTPPTPLYFEYDHYEHTIHPPLPLSPTTTITPIPGNSIQTLPVPIIMDTKPHKPPLSYMPYQNLKLNSIPYTPHHPTEIITMTASRRKISLKYAPADTRRDYWEDRKSVV